MTTDTTARLSLPLLAPGQAQKELWHNEALAALDIAAQASVRGVGTNAPPGDAQDGDCWVVGDAPTGAWADHPRALAGWTAGGWRFLAPREGLAAWDQSSGAVVRFVAGGWTVGDLVTQAVVVGGRRVIGPQQPPVAAPRADRWSTRRRGRRLPRSWRRCARMA